MDDGTIDVIIADAKSVRNTMLEMSNTLRAVRKALIMTNGMVNRGEQHTALTRRCVREAIDR